MRTAGVVLYLVKWHRALHNTLLNAVYIGGDVDSSAALACGLLCSRFGLQPGQPGGVPAFAVRELEALEYVVRIASGFQAALPAGAEAVDKWIDC